MCKWHPFYPFILSTSADSTARIFAPKKFLGSLIRSLNDHWNNNLISIFIIWKYILKRYILLFMLFRWGFKYWVAEFDWTLGNFSECRFNILNFRIIHLEELSQTNLIILIRNNLFGDRGLFFKIIYFFCIIIFIIITY